MATNVHELSHMPGKTLIFLADDNPGDVTLLRIALSDNGVDCDLAVFSDGANALAEIVRAESTVEGQPELFVLDLNLPKVDGITLLKRLRSSDVFHHTPVIIWTSSDSPSDQLKSHESGADRHVCKPAKLAAFLGLGGLIKGMLEEATRVRLGAAGI